MLDPRSLAERRSEIEESCRKRRVRVDLGAAIAAHEAVAARQTELNDRNRERNEHQKSGKRKLEADEREAHNAEGRRLKESVAELETRRSEAQQALDDAMRDLPNFIHPDVPEGGEEDYKVLRSWGEIPVYDFEPRDHLAIAAELDLVDFERDKLASLQKANGPIYRAYLLKESLIGILDRRQVNVAKEKLGEWIDWARRSRLSAFVKLSRTIAKHRDGILAYVQTRANNGRVEGLNGKARTITRRSYGFHSASALIAMLFLCCGGVAVSPAHSRPQLTH